jgi:hypothetical protein
MSGTVNNTMVGVGFEREWVGYSTEEATQRRDEIEQAGGIAFLDRLEGMEMGSGPHFQGYDLYFISPEKVQEIAGVKAKVEVAYRAGLHQGRLEASSGDWQGD